MAEESEYIFIRKDKGILIIHILKDEATKTALFIVVVEKSGLIS